MKEGDLCYIPQGATMIKQDSASLPIGHYTNEKPASALILELEPTAASLYVLFLLICSDCRLTERAIHARNSRVRLRQRSSELECNHEASGKPR